jgi:hypothetical protein
MAIILKIGKLDKGHQLVSIEQGDGLGWRHDSRFLFQVRVHFISNKEIIYAFICMGLVRE